MTAAHREQVRLCLRAASSEKLDCGKADGTLPKAQQYLTAVSKTLNSTYLFSYTESAEYAFQYVVR